MPYTILSGDRRQFHPPGSVLPPTVSCEHPSANVAVSGKLLKRSRCSTSASRLDARYRRTPENLSFYSPETSKTLWDRLVEEVKTSAPGIEGRPVLRALDAPPPQFQTLFNSADPQGDRIEEVNRVLAREENKSNFNPDIRQIQNSYFIENLLFRRFDFGGRVRKLDFSYNIYGEDYPIYALDHDIIIIALGELEWIAVPISECQKLFEPIDPNEVLSYQCSVPTVERLKRLEKVVVGFKNDKEKANLHPENSMSQLLEYLWQMDDYVYRACIMPGLSDVIAVDNDLAIFMSPEGLKVVSNDYWDELYSTLLEGADTLTVHLLKWFISYNPKPLDDCTFPRNTWITRLVASLRSQDMDVFKFIAENLGPEKLEKLIMILKIRAGFSFLTRANYEVTRILIVQDLSGNSDDPFDYVEFLKIAERKCNGYIKYLIPKYGVWASNHVFDRIWRSTQKWMLNFLLICVEAGKYGLIQKVLDSDKVFRDALNNNPLTAWIYKRQLAESCQTTPYPLEPALRHAVVTANVQIILSLIDFFEFRNLIDEKLACKVIESAIELEKLEIAKILIEAFGKYLDPATVAGFVVRLDMSQIRDLMKDHGGSVVL